MQSRHFIVVTFGTRGDVQPYVALGRGLVAAGHRVSIATQEDHEPFVTGHGLGFRPMGGNFRELLDSPAGREWVESGDSLFRYIKAIKAFMVPVAECCLGDVETAVEGADVLLFQPFSLWGVHAAEAAQIPYAVVSYLPFVATRELAPIMFSKAPAWGWLRMALGRMSLRMLFKPFAPLHNAYRAERGLQPMPSDPWSAMVDRGVPFLHLYSETLVPRPSDWPSHATVTGPCFLDGPTEPDVDEELRAFLAEGEPPIYIGFGSMTGRDPETLTRIAIEAIETLGIRAILVTGWGGLQAADLPRTVVARPSVPHDWLFPQVAAVVHHGGAGTVAAGLRAGRPTLVVSFFGDQPYWGHRVELAGAGPAPLHRTRLTADSLSSTIDDLISDPSYAEKAAEIGQLIRRESGVATAVDQLHAWLEAHPGRAGG
jgi:sterol 3beta-glucosyltransferase